MWGFSGIQVTYCLQQPLAIKQKAISQSERDAVHIKPHASVVELIIFFFPWKCRLHVKVTMPGWNHCQSVPKSCKHNYFPFCRPSYSEIVIIWEEEGAWQLIFCGEEWLVKLENTRQMMRVMLKSVKITRRVIWLNSATLCFVADPLPKKQQNMSCALYQLYFLIFHQHGLNQADKVLTFCFVHLMHAGKKKPHPNNWWLRSGRWSTGSILSKR